MDLRQQPREPLQIKAQNVEDDCPGEAGRAHAHEGKDHDRVKLPVEAQSTMEWWADASGIIDGRRAHISKLLLWAFSLEATESYGLANSQGSPLHHQAVRRQLA